MADGRPGPPTPYLEKLEKEHRERMKKLKADADQEIERSRKHKRELVAQSKRHRELLREEMMESRRQRDRVELTARRDHRDFMAAIGGNLSATDEKQLRDEIEEANSNPDDPDVVVLRTWLESEWVAGGIDVRVCVDPALRNGAAARAGNWVEIPPIQSLRSTRKCAR